ncbi:hypothetical protein BGW80DRAFT_1304362 [Lactifluus volemus]|nr:hypothetical protein BGW80DRAFT_1304362 [Lactifluus volemus]
MEVIIRFRRHPKYSILLQRPLAKPPRACAIRNCKTRETPAPHTSSELQITIPLSNRAGSIGSPSAST